MEGAKVASFQLYLDEIMLLTITLTFFVGMFTMMNS